MNLRNVSCCKINHPGLRNAQNRTLANTSNSIFMFDYVRTSPKHVKCIDYLIYRGLFEPFSIDLGNCRNPKLSLYALRRHRPRYQPRRRSSIFCHVVQIEISLACWPDRYFLIDSDGILRYSSSGHCQVVLVINTPIQQLKIPLFLALLHRLVVGIVLLLYFQYVNKNEELEPRA